MKCEIACRETQVCLSMLYFVKNLGNYYHFGLSRGECGLLFKNSEPVIF